VNVFIDESGRFIPGDTWSVVCALALSHVVRTNPDPWSISRGRLRADAYSALPELDALSDKPAE
jgi:hypothetical protein